MYSIKTNPNVETNGVIFSKLQNRKQCFAFRN